MKKIILSIVLFCAACSQKDAVDSEKVALSLLNHSFYSIDAQKAKELAQAGMDEIKKVDPTAEFFDLDIKIRKKDASQTKPSYPVIFQKTLNGVRAAKVFDFSVAYEAGLMPGCVFKKIANIPAEEISLDSSKLEALMSKDAAFNAEYECYGKSSMVEIKRELTYFPFVWSMELNEKVAYLKIMNLSPGVSGFVKNNISNIKSRGIKNLIIDLRGLSTGHYEEAAFIMGLFSENGKTLFELKSDKQGYSKIFTAQNSGAFLDFKLAVLADSSTASLGETIAGFLKSNRNAVLIGGKTAGRFDISRTFRVGQKTGLKLTIAKIYSPYFKTEEAIPCDYEISEKKAKKKDLFALPFFVESDPYINKALQEINR